MIVGLRWFSITNPWMDCLVLVKEEHKAEASRAIRAGIDEFWDEDALCYGDCIEIALKNAGVPYVAEYVEEDEDGEPLDDAWEARLDKYASIGIDIDTL